MLPLLGKKKAGTFAGEYSDTAKLGAAETFNAGLILLL